jgi:hypothetical protein
MNSNRNLWFPTKLTCNLALVLFAAFSFSGCANKMALDANKGNLAKMNKPIAIFTLRTENVYKPSYQPEMRNISFVSSGSQGGKTVVPKKPYKQGKKEYLEYLVSVDLEPGDYKVGLVQGGASSFLVSGNFSFPVNARFNLDSGITYLGRVTMKNRERKEGEDRAGSIFPLIDQSICGFSGGTFDITVADRGETDIPDFVQAYPSLKDVSITKGIMQK